MAGAHAEVRAKEFFRKERVRPVIPSDGELRHRLGAVLHSIYLLFNEGYLSSSHDHPIRRDLLAEALGLGKLLVDNPHTSGPRACVLMALMCFHAPRSAGRLTQEGELVLLPRQDRALGDGPLPSPPPIGSASSAITNGYAGSPPAPWPNSTASPWSCRRREPQRP